MKHFLRPLAIISPSLFMEMAQLQKARFDALEQSRIELEHLNKTKSKAPNHLSHEIKTPLAIIQASIGLLIRKLQKKESPVIGENLFKMLEKHLNRLLQIQMETDKIKKRASHRDLLFHIEGERGLAVSMAPRILEEMLEGLLKNAIENTPDEGIIRILVEQRDRRALLSVQDLGIGITPENQRYTFDGFFPYSGDGAL